MLYLRNQIGINSNYFFAVFCKDEMYFFKTADCVTPTFTGLIFLRISNPYSSIIAPIDELRNDEEVLVTPSKESKMMPSDLAISDFKTENNTKPEAFVNVSVTMFLMVNI